MYKTIELKIKTLEALSTVTSKVNAGINRVVYCVHGQLVRTTAYFNKNLNSELQVISVEARKAAHEAVGLPDKRFQEAHEELADFREYFSAESKRMLDKAQEAVSPTARAEAQTQAAKLRRIAAEAEKRMR